jgi:hypothetical protein
MRLRQEDWEFKVCLGYVGRPCLKIKQNKVTIDFLKFLILLSMVVYTCNPSTQEAEAEGTPRVPGQPKLHIKSLFQCPPSPPLRKNSTFCNYCVWARNNMSKAVTPWARVKWLLSDRHHESCFLWHLSSGSLAPGSLPCGLWNTSLYQRNQNQCLPQFWKDGFQLCKLTWTFRRWSLILWGQEFKSFQSFL